MNLTDWLDMEVYPRLTHEKIFGDLPGFRRVGRGYVALCPVHAESTPSFSMPDGRPFGHCFGCGQTLSWWKYLEMKGLTGQQVIRELARLAGVTPLLASSGFPAEVKKAAEEAEEIEKWWQKARASLWQPEGTDVLEYLRRRGYGDDTIREMDVGATYPEPVPGRIKLPPPEYRLLIPARSRGGRIIGFAGRRTDGKEPKYQYSTGFKKSEMLWGFHRLRRDDVPVICEGVIDAEYIAAAGNVRGIVALGGSDLSDAQAELLARYRRVILALDADDAGRRGTERAIMKLTAKGVKTFVILDFAGAKDPDEYARVHGVAAFADLARRAVAGHRWLTRRLVPDGELSDLGRDAVLEKALDLAETFSRFDPVAASEVIAEAAGKLTLSEVALAEAVDRLSEKRRRERAQSILLNALEKAQKALRGKDDPDDPAGTGPLAAARIVAAAKEEAEAVLQKPPEPVNIGKLEDRLLNFPDGLKFPWPRLNAVTRIDAGGLTVIAAGTHHGKSTFGYNLVLHYLESNDGAVVFWSGEIEESLVYARLVSILAGAEFAATMSSFRRWEFTPAETHAREKLARLAAGRLYLVDALRSDIVDCDRLAAAVKNIARRQEITAIFVDYLQILGPPEKTDGSRYANREQEVTAIAKALHFLAVELGVPVIAFAQINRNNFQYKERPRVTDLRESGGIEQYAQAVLGLWNSSIAGKREVEAEPAAPSEGWYWSAEDAPEGGPAIAMAESHGGVLLEVSVLKHRLRGNVGKAVPLLLYPAAGRIVELPSVPGPLWKEKEKDEGRDESKKVTMLKGAKRR
jgi:DNA primase